MGYYSGKYLCVEEYATHGKQRGRYEILKNTAAIEIKPIYTDNTWQCVPAGPVYIPQQQDQSCFCSKQSS